MRKPYPTDLSDAEWKCIEPHLPTPKADGRPRIHPLREILNAIFYIVRSGCAWRLLPHEFPPWKTVHHYFRTWRIDGIWKKLHAALRERLRVRMGRDPQPSAGIHSGFPVGEDYLGGRRGSRIRRRQEGKGKKTSLAGRHRRLGAKSEGPCGQCNRPRGDRTAARGREKAVPAPSFPSVVGRSGYRGKDKGRGWVEKVLGWSVDLVERPRKPAPEEVLKSWAAEWAKEGEEVDWQKLMPPRGFQVLPRRWVVERTFSWIDQNRRMSKDYERLTESSEAFIYVAMSRL